MNINDGATLNIVCGNESADLDSIVSAISYCYFSFKYNSSVMAIPVINIPREDLNLRRDVIFVLNKINISPNLLYFKEDLHNMKERGHHINLTLVDHNDPQKDILQITDNIVGIIDHHDDAGLYKFGIEKVYGVRLITPSGSCSSLVVNYWLRKLEHQQLSIEDLFDPLFLCLSAGLIDTSNFNQRVEVPDLKALDIYKKKLKDTIFEDYYKKISEARDNIDHMCFRDILRKDYKEFLFCGSNVSIKVGMSSIIKSFDWIFDQYKEEVFEGCCKDYIKEREQDILIILTNYAYNGEFRREICFFTDNKNMLSTISVLIKKVKVALLLKELPVLRAGSSFQIFMQLNTDASRKKISPLIRQVVRDL